MESVITEHPEYKSRKSMWRQYRDLYVGGEQIRANAGEYLMRRNKEPLEIYEQRLGRVFYENYVGSIIDWYGATLFRREPVLAFETDRESSRCFFGGFTQDCDLKGTSFTDFFRKQFIDALVFGASYTLIDFPAVAERPATRAEEDACGASRAYLVSYTPEHLINWSYDENGKLETAVLRTSSMRRDETDSEWREETTWVSYDRQCYRVYRAQRRPDGSTEPTLVRQGRHALAPVNTVPLVEVRVQEGLWLMNKAALLQLEHFNKSNALAWAITMGLFAMPIVYSDRPWNQIVGESYFIQMGPEDRFGWAEPDGKVYQIAAGNLARLKDEIYRICYLLNQAGGIDSGISQSGLSKIRDFAITQEVLRAYGDGVKDAMRRILGAVATARGDEITIDVSGMDEFDIADFQGDLEDAEKLLALGVESPTLKRYIFKRLAHKYLCDVRQEVKDRISAEIDQQFS